ncbi:MAG: TonB-dependent receptor plug domain-containing protein [Elusimicrobia bacterium]|nr:TonB-dependent receptor plug domain-containing protein [Candidatus Obscuribacterium magneticum]
MNNYLFRLMMAAAILLNQGGLSLAAGENPFSLFEEEAQVVTASKKMEKVSDVPASVVIITRKDIEKYGYTSLEDILANIPGLYKIDPYYWFGTMTYGVRGFYSVGSFSDMVVMVNGVSQQEDYYESYPLSKIAVPVEAIDRIEVIRGPMSVIYGNGAFFGAINIITNQPEVFDKPNLVSASYGTGGDYRGAVRGASHSGDITVVGNASAYGTDGIDEPYKKMITSPSGLGAGLSDDGSFKGQLEDHRRFMDLSGDFGNFHGYLSYIQTKMGIVDVFPSPSPKGHQIDVSAANASLNYEKKFSPEFSLKGTLGDRSYVINYDYELFNENNYAPQIFDAHSYNVALDAFYTPTHQLNTLAGIERRTVDGVRGSLDLPGFGDFYQDWEQIANTPIITDSAYTQVDYKPWNKLKAVAGVRVEKTHDYDLLDRRGITSPQLYIRRIKIDTITVPRAALIYSPTREHAVKLMYGEAVKKPAFGNQIDLVPFPSVSALVPATMKTTEVNILSTWSRKLMTSVSFFNNELDKLISREQTPVGNSLVLLSRNAGKQSTNGVEVGILSEPFQNVETEISGTFQESKDKAPGRTHITPGYAPRFLGYGKASYRFVPKASLSAVGRYVSKMEAAYDNNLNARLGPAMGPYFVMDVNLRLEDLLRMGSFISVRVSNIFNREIRYPVTPSELWPDKGTLDRGRELLVSLGYKF